MKRVLALALFVMAIESATAETDVYGDALPLGAVARLGTARFRHEGDAQSLVFSPNGKLLAALTKGGVLLWDARNGKQIRRWSEIRGYLTIGRLIDFSPNGRTLAGPCDNNHIGLWDTATGKRLHVFAVLPKEEGLLPPHVLALHTIRFSPDGKFLVVAGDGNRSYVLDAATGKPLHHFKEDFIDCPIFSPDSKSLAMGAAIRFNPNTYEIQWRDVLTGKILRRWQMGSETTWSLAFSADGKLLAKGGKDRIAVLDTVTGKVRTRIEKKKMGQIRNLAFAPDGKTLFSASENDGKVHVWDIAAGAEKRQLDPHQWVLRSMALSPDGKTVAAGATHNTVRLWDVASGKELFPDPPGHNASVNAVAYSPDGKLLVSAGENRQTWLWDTATDKPIRQIRVASVQRVAFSPDSQRLALLTPGRSSSGENIRICDVANGKELFRVPPRDVQWVNALAYSPDGKTLVSAGWKTTGKNVGFGILNVYDAATGKFLRHFTISGFSPDALAFRGDGRILAIGGSWVADSIRFWEWAHGEEIVGLRGHEHSVSCLAFSPDGQMLVSGGTDRTVRLWEVATGKEIVVLKGHKREIATVAFSPDGRLVASGCEHPLHGQGPNAIRIWDVAAGAEVQRFQGHNSAVSSLAFSRDGTRLASGHRNSTVVIWQTPKSPPPYRGATSLQPQELAVLWSELAGDDARQAHTAIWRLIASPKDSVPFLAKRLLAAPPLDAKRLRRLIADLDSEQFTVREAASRDLYALGKSARPFLRRALADRPTLEVRKRLETLLSRTRLPHGEALRGVRAVEALEHIGDKPACDLLQRLAQGAERARLTQEARASLQRLRLREKTTDKKR